MFFKIEIFNACYLFLTIACTTNPNNIINNSTNNIISNSEENQISDKDKNKEFGEKKTTSSSYQMTKNFGFTFHSMKANNKTETFKKIVRSNIVIDDQGIEKISSFSKCEHVVNEGSPEKSNIFSKIQTLFKNLTENFVENIIDSEIIKSNDDIDSERKIDNQKTILDQNKLTSEYELKNEHIEDKKDNSENKSETKKDRDSEEDIYFLILLDNA